MVLPILLLVAPLAGGAPARPGLPPSLETALADGLEAREAGMLGAWWAPRGGPPSEDAVRVVLALEPEVDPEDVALAIGLAFPDVEVEDTAMPPGASGLVQAVVPWVDLAAVAVLPGVRRAREPWRPHPAEAASEGLGTMGVHAWHDEGVDGRGVGVAVLDVGFAGYGQLLGTDLPEDVDTSFRTPQSGSAHGSAVAEIVCDVAPDVDLGLYTFGTEVDFVAAVEEIAADGWDVVNGSVGFDNTWHADGTSPVSRAVDDLVDGGTLYVAAAGNENDRYRTGPLALGDGGIVSIDGLAPIRVLPYRGLVDVSLRWSDPMESSSNDLDLFVYDAKGGLCGSSGDSQDGRGTPYEHVTCVPGTSEATAEIRLVSGGVDGLDGFLHSWGGLPEEEWSNARNLSLPSDAAGSFAVGAVELPDTDAVAWYSSRGPTDDGRPKPEVVGPSGVTTTTWGRSGFSGTSSAAPHVAGAAALVLDADDRHMGPGEVADFLEAGAVDIGDPGWDDASGAGRVRLDEIPWRGCHCGAARPARTPPLPLAVIAALLVRRRRDPVRPVR